MANITRLFTVEDLEEILEDSKNEIRSTFVERHRWYRVNLTIFRHEGKIYSVRENEPGSETCEDGIDRFWAEDGRVMCTEMRAVWKTVTDYEALEG